MNYRIIEKIGNDRYYIQYEKEIFGKKMWFNILDENMMFESNNHPEYWLSSITFWLLITLGLMSVVGIMFIFGFDMFKTKKFYTEYDAKDFIEIERKIFLEDIQKKELIEKKGKSKIVGVYLGDEYIDGERLERIKKFERLSEDE